MGPIGDTAGQASEHQCDEKKARKHGSITLLREGRLAFDADSPKDETMFAAPCEKEKPLDGLKEASLKH